MSKMEEENRSLRCRGKPDSRPDETGNKVKNPNKYFELMTNLLQKSLHKPNIAADIEAKLNPVLDQIVDTASESDASFRKEAEDIREQVNSCERADNQQQSNTQTGNSSIAAGGQVLDAVVEAASKSDKTRKENIEEVYEQESSEQQTRKDIDQNQVLDAVVEAASKSDKTLKENIEEVYEQESSGQQTREDIDQNQVLDAVVEAASKSDKTRKENIEEVYEQESSEQQTRKDIDQNQVHFVLDAVVEAASKSDKSLKEKIEEVYEQESSKQQTRKDIDQNQLQNQDANTTDDGERNINENGTHLNRGNADSLSLPQPSATSGVEQVPVMHRPHVWSVASKQSYNIKVEKDLGCKIVGCCQLPTGELIMVDNRNNILKKLNAMYQVVSVCDLTGNLSDVCYIGSNEAVVSSFNYELHFVDVLSMTLTRSVQTVHRCHRLTCHGTKLYVVAPNSVYVYRADGTEQRILYTMSFDISRYPLCYSIAADDEGGKIYITSGRLFTIDSSGNHLFTLGDHHLDYVSDVCVDGEGNALVCNLNTGSILQVSHDGKHMLGAIANIGNENPVAIFFDRHKSTLICAGRSNNVTVLQLK